MKLLRKCSVCASSDDVVYIRAKRRECATLSEAQPTHQSDEVLAVLCGRVHGLLRLEGERLGLAERADRL